MPVTESPTAVAVQNYTQVNDPGLNFHFHHNNVNLEFCSFILHFIYHLSFLSFYCCCCCFIGKSKIDKLLLPKVVHLMVK